MLFPTQYIVSTEYWIEHWVSETASCNLTRKVPASAGRLRQAQAPVRGGVTYWCESVIGNR